LKSDLFFRNEEEKRNSINRRKQKKTFSLILTSKYLNDASHRFVIDIELVN